VPHVGEALRYKPEGCRFDSLWGHWDFSLTETFRPHYGPGIDSASNSNEHKEYFLGGKGGRYVELKYLPHSCADCRKIWEPQPLGIFRASPGLLQGLLYFYSLRKLVSFFVVVVEVVKVKVKHFRYKPELV
jgi:hypothetical protein